MTFPTIEEQRAADVDAGLPQCSVCGCTPNAACEDGCAWAQLLPEPVCTRCAS